MCSDQPRGGLSARDLRLDNECYATTGGQPVPNAKNVAYDVIARGCGYSPFSASCRGQPRRSWRMPAAISACPAIARPSTVMTADDVSGSHRVTIRPSP